MNRSKIIQLAQSKLGEPYGLGHKWDIHDPNAHGLIDCSGFVRWCYYQGSGIVIPDGSWNQYSFTVPTNSPSPADLRFLRGSSGQIDHVGMMLDDKNMIEAHGHLVLGKEPPMQVVIRPIAEWEEIPGVTEWRTVK